MQAWIQKDSRILYFKKKNEERGAARNFGVLKASGEYVTFIDSDDIAYPFALETAYVQLMSNGWPPCFASRYEVKDKATMKPTVPPPTVNSPLANEALKKSNVLGCMGVFMKREVALALPFEEDRLFAGSEDWLLWLKLGARYPIPYSQEICYCYFQHESRSVMGFSEEKLKYRAESIRRYLLADELSVKAYGLKTINRIYAHMLTYAALHLAMSRKPGRALQYLKKGIQANFGELFRRRTLGIFKTILSA
jgi:glycosyltransferase involved in cell wall biosynthesis